MGHCITGTGALGPCITGTGALGHCLPGTGGLWGPGYTYVTGTVALWGPLWLPMGLLGVHGFLGPWGGPDGSG